jgi:curved DNA-binding protein CbpA
MQQITDPYRSLGVSRSATEAEIKAAHRKLAKRYHPDSGSKSDTDRFLSIQEAYRVLSDPLLRKEWDQKHAPGPVRAEHPQPPASPRRRRPNAPAPAPQTEPAQSTAPPRDRAQDTDPRARPRSARAYTWSASEVPWWEEARADKRQSARPGDQETSEPPEPTAPPEEASDAQDQTPAPDQPAFGQQDFDVYNRSSGAAWSMAARAYFRKGEADVPRRGSFRHEGTQVVTAGRARAAAQSEARRRAAAAAAATMADVYATTQTVPHSPGPREGTTHIVRRSVASRWPSLIQRFGYAIIAWLPIAGLVAAASVTSGDELVGLALTTASLGLLLAVPRVAYIAALATLLTLLIGGLFVGGMLLTGKLPPLDDLAVFGGGMLLVGYLATAAVVVIGPHSLRPWSAR